MVFHGYVLLICFFLVWVRCREHRGSSGSVLDHIECALPGAVLRVHTKQIVHKLIEVNSLSRWSSGANVKQCQTHTPILSPFETCQSHQNQAVDISWSVLWRIWNSESSSNPISKALLDFWSMTAGACSALPEANFACNILQHCIAMYRSYWLWMELVCIVHSCAFYPCYPPPAFVMPRLLGGTHCTSSHCVVQYFPWGLLRCVLWGAPYMSNDAVAVPAVLAVPVPPHHRHGSCHPTELQAPHLTGPRDPSEATRTFHPRKDSEHW